MTTPETPKTPQPRTDIYARIRKFAPVLIVVFCAGLLVIVALIRPFGKPPVDIELRSPLVASEGDPTAAYVVVHNGGGSDTLLSASTPAADSVVLQQWQTSDSDPAGHLVTVDSLDVPGFGDLRMQPGSDQLLLTGLRAPLVIGETIPITLTFERSGERTVEAEAQPYEVIGDRLLPPRLKVPTAN
jgi:copper(I)-binding protein